MSEKVHFNQFAIVDKSDQEMLSELTALGFVSSDGLSDAAQLSNWLDIAPVRSDSLQATPDSSWTDFVKSDSTLTWDIFYTLGLQLLDFVVNFDFQPTDSLPFAQETGIWTSDKSLNSENLREAFYKLLCTRSKLGMTLVEKWVSEGLLLVDNSWHFFNDKSLATWDTSDASLIRENVWVETDVDTFHTGHYDLVKVWILRPQTSEKLPVVMTASPYHPGTNDIADEKRMHDNLESLKEKSPHDIQVTPNLPQPLNYPKSSVSLTDQAEITFKHCWTSSLNDYLLARGFASVYVAGVGTQGSTGMQTSGDYQQVYSMKAVIDWLNGRARAFTSPKRTHEIKATWASGKVATTGKSYLGTMSYGLATTGVEGLKVILAESGISSWYDYYREGGLVRSPGGFPGEDLDVLAELTYSRNLDGADFLADNNTYQKALETLTQAEDRPTGDYSQFWANRNYLPQTKNVHCDVLIEHGLQDWNVLPTQAYKFWNALPASVTKHAILHRGAHIYSNAWQSLDYSELINTYFTAKLLDKPLSLDLPPVIVQENGKHEAFTMLPDWAGHSHITFPLGDAHATYENHYPEDTFTAYCKDYKAFKKDLIAGQANAITLDIPLHDNLFIQGDITLDVKLKTTDTKGLLSAKLYDYGEKKRLVDTARILEPKALDRGRNFQLEHLTEIPLETQPCQLLSQGFINLQNRTELTHVEVITLDTWLAVHLTLTPQIYQLEKGDMLRLLLYSTDFEHTIRDNREATTTIDLAHSTITFTTH